MTCAIPKLWFIADYAGVCSLLDRFLSSNWKNECLLTLTTFQSSFFLLNGFYTSLIMISYLYSKSSYKTGIFLQTMVRGLCFMFAKTMRGHVLQGSCWKDPLMVRREIIWMEEIGIHCCEEGKHIYWVVFSIKTAPNVMFMKVQHLVTQFLPPSHNSALIWGPGQKVGQILPRMSQVVMRVHNPSSIANTIFCQTPFQNHPVSFGSRCYINEWHKNKKLPTFSQPHIVN